MPVTIGTQIRTVADIYKTVLKCSVTEANALERETCKSASAIAKLATACGFSTLTIGYGGVLIVGTGTAPAGIVLTAIGAKNAKKFCSAMVDRVNESISSAGSPTE